MGGREKRPDSPLISLQQSENENVAYSNPIKVSIDPLKRYLTPNKLEKFHRNQFDLNENGDELADISIKSACQNIEI
jgi:hypothetical protein